MRKALALLTLVAFLLAPVSVWAQANPAPLTAGGSLQSAATATGNGSTLLVSQMSTVAFQVSGTFVGSIVFEGSVDGTNYVALPSCAGTSAGSTVSATGLWLCNVTGIGVVRARISVYTSGSISVSANATSSASGAAGLSGGAGSQMQFYSQTLNPVAMPALTGNIVARSAEQDFTVTGLATGQTVFINGPAPTALCPPSNVRVSAASTMTVNFLQLTSAVCTPATGTYQIVAAPPSGAANVGTAFIQTFNPVAMAALTGNISATSAEQNFTVTGVTTANRVFVNGPAPTALCPPVHWRVSAGNTVTGSFVQLTAAICTPATGTYQVVAL
jgi:hypothetical protein